GDAWPHCETDNGIHTVVELGNRIFAEGVIGLFALLAVIFTWKFRKLRPDWWRLALLLIGGVLVQGILGGITVVSALSPWWVGLHYIVSLAMIGIAAAFVLRAHRSRAPRVRAIPKWMLILTHVTTLVLLIVVAMGVLTTGAGP